MDLIDQKKVVDDFFAVEKPKYVFLAAAKVGGIIAAALAAIAVFKWRENE